ncbi:MAG: hypothetical protein RLZZ344_787, partial [Pseudomonadota bacterium]
MNARQPIPILPAESLGDTHAPRSGQRHEDIAGLADERLRTQREA